MPLSRTQKVTGAVIVLAVIVAAAGFIVPSFFVRDLRSALASQLQVPASELHVNLPPAAGRLIARRPRPLLGRGRAIRRPGILRLKWHRSISGRWGCSLRKPW